MCNILFNSVLITYIYTLSLHDALPIFPAFEWTILGPNGVASFDLGERCVTLKTASRDERVCLDDGRSEEHTSELQSPCNLVCRLLLEKKKKEKHVTVHKSKFLNSPTYN